MKLDNSIQLSVLMSNSIEQLFHRLKEKIKICSADPFFKGLIVVPDLYSKSFLQLELAKNLESGVLLGHKVEAITQARTSFEADVVHLFGFFALSPEWHRTFVLLSEKIPVHYYLLSPCMLFWGDICSDREAQKMARKMAEPAQEEFKELLYDRSKLLANNATLGREFASLLEAGPLILEEEYVCKSWYFSDPAYVQYIRQEVVCDVVASDPSLLEVIQADLLLLGPKREQKLEFSPSDRSFQLHKVPTVMREIEVLYQEVRNYLHQGLARVLVYAPDIERYRREIQATFSNSYQILGVEQKSLLGYLWKLFELVRGPFLPKSLYTLFQCPAFRAKCDLNAEDLLLLAAYLKTHDLDELGSYWISAGGDISSSDAQVLGKCLAAYRALADDLQGMQEKMALGKWITLFRHLLDTYFALDDEERSEALRLKEALNRLVLQADIELSFLQAKEKVSQKYLEVCQESPCHIFAPIVFATLGQLQSASFDMVCLLGMSEGDFPRYTTDRVKDFGFMHQDESISAMGPIDKALTIEAVLAAKSRLYISYRDYSFVDRCHLEPTAVVADLLDVLEKNFEGPKCVYSHSLDSASDFPVKTIHVRNFAQLGTLEHEVLERVSLHELVQTIKNPVKVYFQKGLGLYLQNRQPNVQASEFELLDSQAIRRIVKEAFFMPQEAGDGHLQKAFRACPKSLKEAALSSLQGEMKKYREHARALEIVPEALFTVELSPFCDKAQEMAPNRWRVPAIKCTLGTQELLLTGQLENVHSRGLVLFGNKSQKEIYKALVELCVMGCLQDAVPVQPALLFVKDGKAQSVVLENPLEHLKQFLEFAIDCQKNPWGVYPDWVDDLLQKEMAPKEFLQPDSYDFSDPYRDFFLQNCAYKDLVLAWPKWQEWARKLYGGVR